MLNAYRYESYLKIFLNIRSTILRIPFNKVRNCIGFGLNDFNVLRYKVLILLKTKYNLDSTIHKSGLNNQYNIYIPKSNFIILREIVKLHFHPSMLYKLNNV